MAITNITPPKMYAHVALVPANTANDGAQMSRMPSA